MISTSLATARADRLAWWWDRCLCATVLLACALALSPGLADPDFWGHVQYGRDALANGLPTTATYTYTADGFPWINHENICEYLMAWGVNVLGPGGVLVIKNVLGIGLLLWIFRRAARQGVAQTPIHLCMLLVAANLMPSWTLRPQLMTYTLFALMIALFDWCFVDWLTPWRALLGQERWGDPDGVSQAAYRRRCPWLLLLVPLFVVWTNAHGGFVAGFCIMAAYLAGRSVEAVARDRRRGLPLAAWLVTIVLACGVATFLNPYGAELHRWLLRAMRVPPPEIMEWHPPTLLSLAWSPWWIMVGVSWAALVATRRPRDLVQMTVLALTMWQACEYRRHIAFYAILFGLWMPVHVDSWLSRLRSKRARDLQYKSLSPRARRALLGALVLGMALLSCQWASRLRTIPVRRASYPVSALQYITDRNLQGNLVVKMNWAQYAVAAFGPASSERPQLKVAFDGRFDTCYPQEVLDMYFDFEFGDRPLTMRRRSPHSPPVDGSRILEYKNPNLVLIDRRDPHPVRVMERHRDRWIVLYQDSVAQLWGRRDMYDDTEQLNYVPPEERVIGDARQTGAVPWPALPRRRAAPTELAGVERP